MRLVALGLLVSQALGGPARAAFDPEEDRPLRITSATGFGILGGAAGGFTGALAGGLLCEAASSDGGGFGCIGGALIGGLTGEFIGIWLGSYAGAELVGGNGGLGWTLVGTTSGALLAAAVLSVGQVDLGDIGWWLLATALPLAGSVIGYELSTSREGPRTIGGSFMIPF